MKAIPVPREVVFRGQRQQQPMKAKARLRETFRRHINLETSPQKRQCLPANKIPTTPLAIHRSEKLSG